MNTFGIKHKVTGMFFAGFNVGGAVKWSEVGMGMTKDQATAQALLLARFDREVQRKPVAI